MAPGPPHEALHRIFGMDEGVFVGVMSQILNVPVPAPAGLDELNVDLTEYVSVDRRSDTVLRVRSETGDPSDDFILLVESQTSVDESRRYSWPYYVSYLQAKHRLEVAFIVVTPSVETARWAREGFRIGPSKMPGLTCQVTVPVVIGPDDTPVLTTAEAAAGNVYFSTLCALTHRLDPEPDLREILGALAPALQTLDEEIAGPLSEAIEAGLADSPGCDIWKALMTSGQFTYVSETRAQGIATGAAETILQVLEGRGIPVDDHSLRRIQSCTDRATLATWAGRAGTIDSIEELFKD